MIEPGTVLQNRYRIEKPIGQGGMGKVYVALDQRFNSTVAIKETVFEDHNLRKAFEREARLLNSLKHQALPRVSDHFIEGDGQFLVMEFIAGEDLAEMMVNRGEAFPLEEVLNWSNQLCDALEYLHAQDIIHRDIKPQNLKLTPNGQIVLLDFGLAKGSPTDAHQTAAKSIFGYSRSYASLEQIQGTGTEPRSDLYSLGATLYHLLTGVPPADALTRAMNVLNGQPDTLIPANVINKNVPRSVAEILKKAMALNANERPFSAQKMRQSLTECDKTIDPNAENSLIAGGFTADLLAQETKLKTATTNVSTDNQSQIATKILSDTDGARDSYKTKVYDADTASKVTQVRPTETQNKKRSRVIAAGIAGLLLAGTAISSIYFYNPRVARVSRSNINPNAANTEMKGTFVITPPENQGFSNVNLTVAANTNVVHQVPETKTPDKQLVATKTLKKKNRNAVEPVQEQTARVTENAPKAAAKSDITVITDERIETKDWIMDEKGIRMKMPQHQRPPFANGGGVFVRPPKLPPTKYNVLSPEQIRKIEELKKLQHQRMIIVKTPTPKPTP